jgi:hypothetical protein
VPLLLGNLIYLANSLVGMTRDAKEDERSCEKSNCEKTEHPSKTDKPVGKSDNSPGLNVGLLRKDTKQ